MATWKWFCIIQKELRGGKISVAWCRSTKIRNRQAMKLLKWMGFGLQQSQRWFSLNFINFTHFCQKKVCVFAFSMKIFPSRPRFPTVFVSLSKSLVLSHVYVDLSWEFFERMESRSMSDAADLHPISLSIYRVVKKQNQKPQDGNQ